jgi:hypothetical protein
MDETERSFEGGHGGGTSSRKYTEGNLLLTMHLSERVTYEASVGIEDTYHL